MARKKFTDDERAERRQHILNAAMQVFETGGGIEAVSFRSVAAAAGCSYSAPYSYFTSKEDLLNALRARAFRWIEGEMNAAIKGKRSATAKLEALARAYINAGISRPHRYALMFFDMDRTEVAQNSIELKAAKRDALGVCTKTIQEGQDSGEFTTTPDALTASHMFWSSAHGVVSLHVAGQFVMGRTLDEVIGPLLQTLQAQLMPPASPARKTANS